MKLPSTNILILTAVCISIIGGTAAYRIAGAAREATLAIASRSSVEVDASSTSSISPNEQILNALQTASLDQIQTNANNPFAILPTDNLTDRLAKNVFTTYASNQYSNASGVDASGNPTGGPTDINTQANTILSNIDTSTLPSGTYSTSELALFSPKTTADLKAYANQFANIQSTNLAVIAADPNTYNNNLPAIAAIYAKIGKQLMQLQAPATTAALQVEIANDFAISADSFNIINKQESDPLKSLLALKTFKEANARQQEAEYELGIYFQQNGILFDNNEPGSFWTAEVTGTSTANASSGNSQ